MSLISNKKAHFNYEIESTMTAGLELFGHEVKSLRASLGSLDGAYIIIRGGEAFLIGSHIPPYQPSNLKTSYDDKRPRKLLLNKSEIKELANIEAKTQKQKGQSIIPLSIFATGKKIKVEIAIAHGKQTFDKRESIKKRDTKREMQRDMKGKF